MKRAVAVKDKKLSCELEYHFGKSPYFAIIDDDEQIEYIRNKNKEESAARGIMTADLLAEKGVSKVYAGEFGIKVKTTLDVLGIEMIHINVHNISLKEFIQTTLKNK
ncbi:MAG: NifB/NifX family molybdenum-iron cluster-binding protein [Bacteroidota bacterium]